MKIKKIIASCLSLFALFAFIFQINEKKIDLNTHAADIKITEDGVTYVIAYDKDFAYVENVNSITSFFSGYEINSYVNGYPVIAIAGSAFFLNTGIEKLKLPNTIKYILDGGLFGGAFCGCSELKEVNLPESVISVGTNAFAICESLDTIIINNPDCQIADSAKTICNDIKNGTPIFNGTIYGYYGSTAQKYAEKYGYNFNPIIFIGDVDNNGTIDAIDASLVLTAYAMTATGKITDLDNNQLTVADANSDGNVNALDASLILSYYAYKATGGSDSFDTFLNK